MEFLKDFNLSAKTGTWSKWRVWDLFSNKRFFLIIPLKLQITEKQFIISVKLKIRRKHSQKIKKVFNTFNFMPSRKEGGSKKNFNEKS